MIRPMRRSRDNFRDGLRERWSRSEPPRLTPRFANGIAHSIFPVFINQIIPGAGLKSETYQDQKQDERKLLCYE